MKPIYRMQFRPVSFCTLPSGIVTEWVRLPKHDGEALRRAYPDLKVSEHNFGEFTTNRELTESEMASFQIERTDQSYVLPKRKNALTERLQTLQAEAELFDDHEDYRKEIRLEIEQCQTELGQVQQSIDELAA